MSNIRPPPRGYNNTYNNTSSSSRLRPPMANQGQSNNNLNKNKNLNNPFPSSRQSPQFSNPNAKIPPPYTNNKQNSTPFTQNNDFNNFNKSESEHKKENQNESQDSYNNIKNQERDEEENYNKKPKTSQKHKTLDSSYSINPNHIPRPNQNDEIYLNNEKLPIYETNIGTAPPHSTSFYSVKETQNSSCRFIRSTLNSVPVSQSLLNETNLIWGLCIQPFAEIPDYEELIPKVQTKETIFRCKQCKSYINNKYNITYSSQNKQVAVCNLCQYENEFDMEKPGIKNEYFNSDYSNCPELVKPTIDFIAPSNFKSSKPFIPHYLVMIDISENSYQIGLPSYVINSVQTNFDSFDNMENSYIGFALYDFKNIYFFYAEKDDISLTIMGDINDPFCPLSMKKLFLNINEQRGQIEKLIERINTFIDEKNQNIQIVRGNRQISTLTGSAIKAGVEALMENGGRLMIFTPNPCKHGFGASSSRNDFNKEKEPQKSNPFYPVHEKFVEIGEKAANNRIVIDKFIFMSVEYDISIFSLVSNLSGRHIESYNYLMVLKLYNLWMKNIKNYIMSSQEF